MAETQDWSAPAPSPVIQTLELVLHASETVTLAQGIAATAGRTIVLVGMVLLPTTGAPTTETFRDVVTCQALVHGTGRSLAWAAASPESPLGIAAIPFGAAACDLSTDLDIGYSSANGAGTQQVTLDLIYYVL